MNVDSDRERDRTRARLAVLDRLTSQLLTEISDLAKRVAVIEDTLDKPGKGNDK